MSRPAPTINDLRVKLCWICREEEIRETDGHAVATESGSRRAWVHPCSCTLIAHQDCLLEWIKESQSRPARRANALKCPQCNTKYIIESENPLLLRIFEQVDQLAARGGIYVSLGVVAGLGVTFLASIYGLSTYYGAHAIRVFIGDKMYNVLIGDDPKDWHWSVYWNLPLVPLYLMATHATSRILRSSFSISNMSLPIIFWLAFPSSTLTMSTSNLMPVSVLAGMHGDSYDFLNHSSSDRILTLSYPPSPALCLLALPFLRAAYVTLRRRFIRWLLQVPSNESLDGNHLDDGAAGLENVAAAGERRQVWVIGGDDDDVDVDGDADGDMEGDGDVGIGADIRIDVDIDRAGRGDNVQQQQQQHQQEIQLQDQNENPHLDPNIEPNAVIPAQEEQQAEAQINADQQQLAQPANPPNQPPRRVRLTFSSFGRFLTKALLTPWIASYSGRILEVISKKWGLLRRILAINVGPGYHINGPAGNANTGAFSFAAAMGWIQRVVLKKEQLHQIPVQGLGRGIWNVNALEPIWWRNTVGLSLWILTRDAITILHLLLKRREMKSRKIVNRSFEGIDVGTLDLIR